MASILTILIIGAIAFLYIKQGIFSAINMAVCTLLAMLVAITQFDFIAGMTGLNAGYCMIALFVVMLYILRMACDSLIKTEIFFPQTLNVVGAGIFGAITGYFVAGVLFVALQLMPMSPSVIGLYSVGGANIKATGAIMPLYPDDVVLAIGQAVSSGSLAGGTELKAGYPDFKTIAHANRLLTTLPKGTGVTEKSLKIIGAYKLDDADLKKFQGKLPKSPFVESGKTQVILVRAEIAGDAITYPEDAYPWWKLNSAQFKLISKQGKKLRVDYPIAYVYETLKDKKIAFATPKKKDGVLNLVDFGIDRHATAANYKAREKLVKMLAENADKQKLNKFARDNKTVYKEKDKLTVDWIFVLPAGANPKDLVFRNCSDSKVSVKPEADFKKFFADAKFKAKILQEYDTKYHYQMRDYCNSRIKRERKKR